MSEPTKLRYIIEYDGYVEQFDGEDPTSWFWSCMDAIKRVIEDWNIRECPKCIRILVHREERDRGEYHWMLVMTFKLAPERPWIDLDALEQDREHLFMLGQALAMAWRDDAARALTEKI